MLNHQAVLSPLSVVYLLVLLIYAT